MAKGKKTGGGSRKGSPNRSGDLRTMIAEALHSAGGVRYLERQAIESPAAFLKLVGQIVPKDVTVSGGAAPVVMQIITGVPDAGSGH